VDEKIAHFLLDREWRAARCISLIVCLVLLIIGTAAAISIFRGDSSIVVGTSAIIATLAALFGDAIKRWIWKPALSATYVHGPDYCEKVVLYDETNGRRVTSPGYYFRLRIRNVGEHRADKIEILATDLQQLQPDNTWPIIRRFSMNLLWTNLDHAAILSGLSPDMERYCDIGHIILPAEREKLRHEELPTADADRTVFSLDLEAKPNHLSHILQPGTYRLTLYIAAANHSPIRKTLEFEITGIWSDESDTMLRNGIRMNLD
jgi:hypothetical protein